MIHLKRFQIPGGNENLIFIFHCNYFAFSKRVHWGSIVFRNFLEKIFLEGYVVEEIFGTNNNNVFGHVKGVVKWWNDNFHRKFGRFQNWYVETAWFWSWVDEKRNGKHVNYWRVEIHGQELQENYIYNVRELVCCKVVKPVLWFANVQIDVLMKIKVSDVGTIRGAGASIFSVVVQLASQT